MFPFWNMFPNHFSHWIYDGFPKCCSLSSYVKFIKFFLCPCSMNSSGFSMMIPSKNQGKPAKKHQASPCRVHALVMGSPSPLRRAGDRRGWDGARAGVLIPSGDTLIRDKWGSNDIFPFFPISSIRRVSSLAARWLAWITSLESQAASAQWRYIRLP